MEQGAGELRKVTPKSYTRCDGGLFSIGCECWPPRWRFCRRFGRSAFLFLVRRGAAAAWSKVRQGVRQDNWSEGRFGCRWLRRTGEKFKIPDPDDRSTGASLRNR